MTAAPITVIVLNWNGMRFLEGCLSSVLMQEYPDFTVLLVDNGSTDGSVAFVRERFPEVRILETGENLGYAGGNNAGVAATETERVVLLNNDTVVAAGWLAELVRAAGPAEIAAVASFVRTEGVPEHWYERNGSINLLGHNVMRVFDDPREIFYPGGTSVLYKRSLLPDPPFDPLYFAYAEDVFLGLRARFAGLEVVMAPDSRVEHVGGASGGGSLRPRMAFLQERNRLLNLYLFFGTRTILRAFPLLVAGGIAKLLHALVTGRRPLSALVKAYGWLLVHPGAIHARRKLWRADRRVGDEAVLCRMSARMTSGEGTWSRAVDRLAILYARLVRLPMVETTRKDRSCRRAPIYPS
ncbi:MAG: glycosyltransferase [Candidatus Eisenbacteria bacterium]|nr:glycosyltransferase [Candidatus Latescibacterota bacterium]MBD3303490.1 glycosyltransferase [Candidatus Eisenbacteria bacterium]